MTTATVNPHGLHRTPSDRMIAGVCGGLAAWLGWDPTVVRGLYVLVAAVSAGFPGILVYLVLWVVMPLGDGKTTLAGDSDAVG